MALISRTYKVAQAIAAALNADTELAAALANRTWQIRKKPIHAGQTWKAGCYVAIAGVDNPGFENKKDLIPLSFIVAVIDPRSDGDNVDKTEESLSIIERVEDIFRHRGADAPASLMALTNLYGNTDPNRMAFQSCDVRPVQERFLASLLGDGYDANAVTVNVSLIVPRKDVSSLGA